MYVLLIEFQNDTLHTWRYWFVGSEKDCRKELRKQKKESKVGGYTVYTFFLIEKGYILGAGHNGAEDWDEAPTKV